MGIIRDAVRRHYGLPPERVMLTTICIYSAKGHPDLVTGTWICADAPEAAELRARAVEALKEKGWRKLPWILTITYDGLVKDGVEARIQVWTGEENNEPEYLRWRVNHQPPFPY